MVSTEDTIFFLQIKIPYLRLFRMPKYCSVSLKRMEKGILLVSQFQLYIEKDSGSEKAHDFFPYTIFSPKLIRKMETKWIGCAYFSTKDLSL